MFLYQCDTHFICLANHKVKFIIIHALKLGGYKEIQNSSKYYRNKTTNSILKKYSFVTMIGTLTWWERWGACSVPLAAWGLHGGWQI